MIMVLLLTHWVLIGPFPSPTLETPMDEGVSRAGYHQDFLSSIGGSAR